MGYPVTAAQMAALMGNHQMSTRVTVFRGAESLGDIPVVSVSASATYGTQGSREALISVDRAVLDAGFLDPLQDQVMIRTGVKDMFEVPIFTGRVDETRDDETGEVSVPLISRGTEVIRAPFIVPWAADITNTVPEEIRRVLQDVDASWSVDTGAANAATMPPGLVWEIDRGQACDQLAQGANLIWQPDRTGGFVVYNNPYSVGPLLGADVQVFLRDGQNGTTVGIVRNEGRDGIYNSVTVVTERVNNTPPIRVTAQDLDPASPTYWGGLFGKQNLVVKNQTPLEIPDSEALALRILRQSLARQRSFNIQTSHMPLLDPGDVFALIYEGITYTLVCETINYSGSAREATSITARELILREGLTLTQ
jgi:hypothetical protein